jgi:hypothetical protein
MPRSDDPNSRGGHPQTRHGQSTPQDARRGERPDYRQPQQPPRYDYSQAPARPEPDPRQNYAPRYEPAPQQSPRAPDRAPADTWRDPQFERNQHEAEINQALSSRRQAAPDAYLGDQFHTPQPPQRETRPPQDFARENRYDPSPQDDYQNLGYAQGGYGGQDRANEDYVQRYRQQQPFPTNAEPVFLNDTAPAQQDPHRQYQNYFDEAPPPNPRPAQRGAPPAAFEPDMRGGNANADPFGLSMDDLDRMSFEPSPPANLAPVQREHLSRDHDEDDLDADFFADEEFNQAAAAKVKKGGAKKLIAAVFTGALVMGGGAAYYLTMEPNGDLPTVSPQAGAVKDTPDNPGGREFPNQGKKVYERLTTSSEPTQTASTAADEAADAALRQAQSGGGALQPTRSPAALDDPRPVRTYTYGPDGSQLTPSRPQQSSGDGSIVVTTGDMTAPQDAPQPSPVRPFETRQQPPRPTTAPAAPPRPQPQTQVAAATVATTAATAGAFVLQLKSSNDQAKAQAELSDMQQKYGPVLGQYGLEVKSVDLGDKGVWFRLRSIGFESREAASGMCEKLKAAGLKDCIVQKAS